jgi:hyperpolarization activated cyclic nucleotide-gated potassium channel 2
VIRFLRLPRVHRLVEVSKIGKFFRQMNKDSYILLVQDFFQENAGMMRLLTIVGTVIVAVHISACFWYLTAKLSDFDEDTWIMRYGYIDDSNGKKYLASLYWAVATILTVGYGDISGFTLVERSFAIIWMMIGVAFYAITIGIITSVLDHIDTKESDLNAKIEIID